MIIIQFFSFLSIENNIIMNYAKKQFADGSYKYQIFYTLY